MESYDIQIIGSSESPFRGSIPEDIDELIKKPDKDVKSLIYQAVKAQIDQCVQKGDTEGAWEAIELYQNKQFEYSSPVNIFRKDMQNGQCPYIGAHAVIGAFRDAAKFLYPDSFYQKKGDRKPSIKHLRKFISVRPYHIFMYRPHLGTSKIEKVDGIDGQQPVGDIKGFSKYEYISPPFEFSFTITLNPKGIFENLLGDFGKVEEIMRQACNHGLGGGRAAGYGMWKIVTYSIEDSVSA